MLKVWTANISYQGKDRLDITVKSGVQCFAPSWEMVMGFKRGTLTKEDYTQKFKNLMDLSRKHHLNKWEELLGREEITLVCYCKPGDFCHRVLLAKMLEQMGAKYLGEKFSLRH